MTTKFRVNPRILVLPTERAHPLARVSRFGAPRRPSQRLFPHAQAACAHARQRALLSMRNQAQQAMLDAFFGSLGEPPHGHWRRGVSDRGFTKVRSRLDPRCLQRLNAWLVEQDDAMALVPGWRGLR